MAIGWAQLPDDLLHDIAMRLKCVADLLAFAGACSSWRLAYISLIKPKWSPPKPWLIMAEDNDDNPLCIRTVVDLNNNKRYQMKLPETFGRHCWGCEDGWIFTLGLDMETHLFNPLTRARLSLPSALTLPLDKYGINHNEPEHKELLRREYILKVHVISFSPSDKLLVMVICQNNDLAAANPGDSKWYSFMGNPLPEGQYLEGLIRHGDSLVAMYEDGKLRFANETFFLNPDIQPIQVSQYLSNHGHFFNDLSSYTYLLDFFGKIIAVSRYSSSWDGDNEEFISDPTIGNLTWLFEVFIFNFDECEWFELSDLGDAALFLGNSSAACVASEGSDCEPNCIYFTDDRPSFSKYMGHDSGIYFMKEHRFKRVYHGVDILSKFCPPFWYMPKLA